MRRERTPHRRHPSLLPAAGAALLLSTALALAEEAVVVSSTAPGQAPGMIVGEGRKLTLPEGASATLLFRSGQMVKLHGPFDGALPEPGSGSSAPDLAGALRMQGVDASVMGGSREVAPSARRAMAGEDIRIDPQLSTTYCVATDDSLWLRRPVVGHELGLRRKQSLRTVSWPGDAAQIEWPDDVMIEDGDEFDLVDASGRAGAHIMFHRIAQMPRLESAWIAQMELMGCAEQARTALRELARSSVTPEIYLASDRGRRPEYRVGEPIRLVIQVNLDGQLYCFAKAKSNAATVPIFPAARAGGAHVEGEAPLSIAGERLGAGREAGLLPGDDEIRCYFADRDITAELPPALLDRNFAPLPEDLAADLDTVFAAVPMTRIAKASLDVTVK